MPAKTILNAVPDFDVKHEEALTHGVNRTRRGYTAEVRVTTCVEVNGQTHEGETTVRIPLQSLK